MNSWLIKRSPSFTNAGLIEKINSKKKGYSETRITSSNRSIIPKDFSVGDVIYVSETGWGIYAVANVTEISNTATASSADEIVDLMVADSRKNEVYWANKLKDFRSKSKKDSNIRFHYVEYVVNQKLLPRPIPLTGSLGRLSQPGLMSSIIKLNNDEVEFIKNPDFTKSKFKLSEHIPSLLRREIWSFFSKDKVQHYIDIDHFVPKSVGGPGNLIYNLVPIGFSLNRYKSNSIPRGFFIEAQKNDTLKQFFSEDHISKGEYIKDNVAIHDAIRINKEIWSWESIEDIENFYRSVMMHHLESYVEVLDNYKKQRGY